MKKHLVSSGDTLQSISLQYTGSIGNWITIGQYNGLLSSNLTPGTFLHIPDIDAYGNVLETLSDLSGEVESDLDFSDGDLSSDSSGDLKVISGVDVIAQELQRRFNTSRGERLLHPDYGATFSDLIGCNANLKRFELEVLDVIFQDERVLDAEIISISKEGNRVYIKCNIMVSQGSIATTFVV